MTSSDKDITATSILNKEQVSIGALEREHISVEARLVLADHEHKNMQEALDKENERKEKVAQSKHKRNMDIGTNIFIAFLAVVLGTICIGIISNPKSPNELTKWACGILGTFTGASAGLIRRP